MSLAHSKLSGPARRNLCVFRRSAPPSRATALIAAIAVLAILTILVMGFAAALSASRQSNLQAGSRAEARAMARLALECAAADLGHHGPDAAERSGQVRRLPEGAFSYAFHAILPDDAVYRGKFLNHRPGDVRIEVKGSTCHPMASVCFELIYLVNIQPDHPRCIMLNETIGAAALQTADMTDAASKAANNPALSDR